MTTQSIRGLPERIRYRHNGVEVTTRRLIIGRDRYEIDELADLAVTRGSMHLGAKFGVATAVGEAVLLVPLTAVLASPVVWLVGVAAFLVPATVGLVCALRWPAEFRLHGRYRGRDVTLYITRNAREFGQITRALIRSTEAPTH
jgi:hypothetical protein